MLMPVSVIEASGTATAADAQVGVGGDGARAGGGLASALPVGSGRWDSRVFGPPEYLLRLGLPPDVAVTAVIGQLEDISTTRAAADRRVRRRGRGHSEATARTRAEGLSELARAVGVSDGRVGAFSRLWRRATNLRWSDDVQVADRLRLLRVAMVAARVYGVEDFTQAQLIIVQTALDVASLAGLGELSGGWMGLDQLLASVRGEDPAASPALAVEEIRELLELVANMGGRVDGRLILADLTREWARRAVAAPSPASTADEIDSAMAGAVRETAASPNSTSTALVTTRLAARLMNVLGTGPDGVAPGRVSLSRLPRIGRTGRGGALRALAAMLRDPHGAVGGVAAGAAVLRRLRRPEVPSAGRRGMVGPQIGGAVSPAVMGLLGNGPGGRVRLGLDRVGRPRLADVVAPSWALRQVRLPGRRRPVLWFYETNTRGLVPDVGPEVMAPPVDGRVIVVGSPEIMGALGSESETDPETIVSMLRSQDGLPDGFFPLNDPVYVVVHRSLDDVTPSTVVWEYRGPVDQWPRAIPDLIAALPDRAQTEDTGGGVTCWPRVVARLDEIAHWRSPAGSSPWVAGADRLASLPKFAGMEVARRLRDLKGLAEALSAFTHRLTREDRYRRYLSANQIPAVYGAVAAYVAARQWLDRQLESTAQPPAAAQPWQSSRVGGAMWLRPWDVLTAVGQSGGVEGRFGSWAGATTQLPAWRRMMYPLPPLLPAVDQPAAVDVRAGERLELDASDGVGAFNAVNLAYQSNLVAMLTGHGPIDYPRVIAIIHACSTDQRQRMLLDPTIAGALRERLPDNHRVAAFFALLEGSLHWKNWPNDFKTHFFLQSRSDPLPHTATMNCFEGIVYAAQLAGVVSLEWISELYRRWVLANNESEAWAILGFSKSLPRYSDINPQVGDLLFYGRNNSPAPGHVALSIGGDQALSLWRYPNDTLHVQRIRVSTNLYHGLDGTVYIGTPPW